MSGSAVTVGIICPTPGEYRTCRELLRLTDEVKRGKRLISSRYEKGVRMTSIQAGPGKIQGASATQWMIDEFQPDVVIDVGGAGSLAPEAAIFDIVCAEYAYEYDVCPIEEFPHYAGELTVGTMLSDLSREGKGILSRFAEWVKSEKSTGFQTGNIASGERNVNESTMREALHTTFRAVACDWETSAVLKTALINGVKTLSFRVITDNAGEEMSKEFHANWKKALRILYPVLEEFLMGGWLFRILKCVKEEE